MKDAGISLAIYANCSVRATVRVIQEVFEKIKTEKTLSAVNEDIVPMETIFDLIRVDQLKDNQNRYGS